MQGTDRDDARLGIVVVVHVAEVVDGASDLPRGTGGVQRSD